MRRIVAIQAKTGVAVGMWALGALCVAAEVRLPGFWYEKFAAAQGMAARPTEQASSVTGQAGAAADGATATAAVAGTDHSVSNKNQSLNQTSANAESAAHNEVVRNVEVAAEQQASQAAPASTQTQVQDSHTRVIVISIPDRQLALLVDGELMKVYAVAVGAKHSPSPEGEYTVINHSVNPTYRHKDKKIEPGKDNPLGTRWMGLSLKGYGIHGTNVQSSIGKATSHGCFRMKKKDVEELYELVQVGDIVSIRGQRDELTAQLFTAPAVVVTAKNDTPSPAVNAAKAETELVSAAQNTAATAGGGGQ